jgi:hypothetical protein
VVTDEPPSGVLPITVPSDVVLVRRPELVVWAGAVTAFPAGFAFTLLTLFDIRNELPPYLVRDVQRLNHETWLTVRFSDGRYREVTESSLNRPPGQPHGPQLRSMDNAAHWTDGWRISRWWVTPLPPPGPVELAVHLGGAADPSGVAHLDGTALVEAAARAEVLWSDGRITPG